MFTTIMDYCNKEGVWILPSPLLHVGKDFAECADFSSPFDLFQVVLLHLGCACFVVVIRQLNKQKFD